MTAKLATRDDRILAGVEEADALGDGSTILHSASDKSQAGCLQFDPGYVSLYFVTDPGRMEVVLEEVYILSHEKRLSSKSELIPQIEQITKSGKPPAYHSGECWRRGGSSRIPCYARRMASVTSAKK